MRIVALIFLEPEQHRPERLAAYADVTIGGTPAGRVTIELFADIVPKTAENVRQFFTGEYRYATWHTLMIQQYYSLSSGQRHRQQVLCADETCSLWGTKAVAFIGSSRAS